MPTHPLFAQRRCTQYEEPFVRAQKYIATAKTAAASWSSTETSTRHSKSSYTLSCRQTQKATCWHNNASRQLCSRTNSETHYYRQAEVNKTPIPVSRPVWRITHKHARTRVCKGNIFEFNPSPPPFSSSIISNDTHIRTALYIHWNSLNMCAPCIHMLHVANLWLWHSEQTTQPTWETNRQTPRARTQSAGECTILLYISECANRTAHFYSEHETTARQTCVLCTHCEPFRWATGVRLNVGFGLWGLCLYATNVPVVPGRGKITKSGAEQKTTQYSKLVGAYKQLICNVHMLHVQDDDCSDCCEYGIEGRRTRQLNVKWAWCSWPSAAVRLERPVSIRRSSSRSSLNQRQWLSPMHSPTHFRWDCSNIIAQNLYQHSAEWLNETGQTVFVYR